MQGRGDAGCPRGTTLRRYLSALSPRGRVEPGCVWCGGGAWAWRRAYDGRTRSVTVKMVGPGGVVGVGNEARPHTAAGNIQRGMGVYRCAGQGRLADVSLSHQTGHLHGAALRRIQ